MSEENLEIVSEWVEAFNRRDTDGFLAGLHPDVEWDDTEGFPGIRGLYRGRAEAREWLEQLIEDFEEAHLEIEEITALSDDRVLIVSRATGRGRGSGVPVEPPSCEVSWLADGLITRRQVFWTRDEGLEAAGLSE